MAPKVAEALRRIQPELIPVPQFGEDWAFCQIGGKLIPIHAQEVPDVYRQVQQLLSRKLTAKLNSGFLQNRRKTDGLILETAPADAA
jgi:hypothetical protein